MCTGIDRLNGIIQKLIQCCNPPAEGSVGNTYICILCPSPTDAVIVATCKGYDRAMEQQGVNSVIGMAHTVSEKCCYPKCGERPYCCSVLTEQEGAGKAKLKRAGRSRRGATGSLQRNPNHVRPLVGVVHAMCVAPRSIVLF